MVMTKKRAEETLARDIAEELRKIKEAMDTADAAFNEVDDPDLIESLIFERSSLNARYSYLIKERRRIEKQG